MLYFACRYIHGAFWRVVEAMIVAGISATISFLVIFFYDDCQPMRAEPASYPVQV